MSEEEKKSEDSGGESGADGPQNNAEQSDSNKAPMEKLTNEPQQDKNSGETPNIDVIMEVPVKISLEVGSTDISIRNLLKLSQGSVVELDRFAGEPLDVFVNNTLIAHGEVVVVNEKFGIRLTDVLSAAERIKKLGEQDT